MTTIEIQTIFGVVGITATITICESKTKVISFNMTFPNGGNAIPPTPPVIFGKHSKKTKDIVDWLISSSTLADVEAKIKNLKNENNIEVVYTKI